MSESIFKKIDRFSTKISDIIYKDKWDPNCLNTALFSDDDPNKPAVAAKTESSMSNFEQQIQAYRAAESAKKPEVKPEVLQAMGDKKMADAPIERVEPEKHSNSIFNEPVAGPTAEVKGPSIEDTVSVPSQEDKSKEEVRTDKPKEEARTSALFPNGYSVDILPKKKEETEDAKVKKSDNVEETVVCFYTHITHTKTYPARGSCVMYRNCDMQYAWKDDLGVPEPDYEFCPKCGKRIIYTKTTME